MAIVNDVLEDDTIPANPILGTPASRTIKYTARQDAGTMYYWVRGGLDPVADLTALVNSMTQELYDDAAANGTAIPDLVTDVYIQKRRVKTYLEAWQILKSEVGDLGITLTQLLNHLLTKLGEDAGLTVAFKADAWRLGLIANPTDALPSMGTLTETQRREYYKQIKDFFLGLTVGIAGNFILDDYLE